MAADLGTLLADTRRAVLTGDMAALGRLVQETEAVEASTLPRDAAQLRRLRSMAETNAALLAAAVKGVAAARRRLRELSGEGRFSTYDASGRRGQLTETSAPPARRL